MIMLLSLAWGHVLFRSSRERVVRTTELVHVSPSIRASKTPETQRWIFTRPVGTSSAWCTGVGVLRVSTERLPECNGELPPTLFSPCVGPNCTRCQSRRGGMPPIEAWARVEQCTQNLTEDEARESWSGLSVSDILPAHLHVLKVERVAQKRIQGWCNSQSSGSPGKSGNEETSLAGPALWTRVFHIHELGRQDTGQQG